MKIRDVTGRFLREESGFTLTEILVTSIMMFVVLSAIYSVSEMSLRAFSTGNNKAEAVANARVGLQKMEREIRAAYPASSGSSTLFFNANGSTGNPPQQMPSATQITFGNDLGFTPGEGTPVADGVITCGSPCEYITYKLTDDSSGIVPCTAFPCTLRRVNAASSADPNHQDPMVENVDPGGPNNGIVFRYLKNDGTTATSEDQIGMVLVSLDVREDSGIYNSASQTLTTAIDLRDRSCITNPPSCP